MSYQTTIYRRVSKEKLLENYSKNNKVSIEEKFKENMESFINSLKKNGKYSSYEAYVESVDKWFSSLGIDKDPSDFQYKTLTSEQTYNELVDDVYQNIDRICEFIEGGCEDFELLGHVLKKYFSDHCLDDLSVFKNQDGFYEYCETHVFELPFSESDRTYFGRENIVKACKDAGENLRYKVYNLRGKSREVRGWTSDFEFILDDLFNEYGNDLLVAIE